MATDTTYLLPLKTLPQGTHVFDYTLDKAFFSSNGSVDITDASLSVHLQVQAKAHLFTLTFTLSGTVTVACDRCLDPMQIPVETNYSTNVRLGQDFDDSADDLIIVPETQNHLDLAPLLRDTAELAVPLQHAHPAGQCNPSMSQLLTQHQTTVGTDTSQSTDPRWDALRNLTSQNN